MSTKIKFTPAAPIKRAASKAKTPAKPQKAAAKPLAPSPADVLAAPAPVGGKLGQMVTLLRRSQGATIADLTKATGWQKHSVRGALAGALKAKGFVIASDKPADVRIYCIQPPPEVAVARAKLAGKRK